MMTTSTLQDSIAAQVTAMQIEWEIDGYTDRPWGDAEAAWLLIAAVIVTLLGVAVVRRPGRGRIIIVAATIAALSLSSCMTAYRLAYEQPIVGGTYTDRGECRSTIRVGRKKAVITAENGLKKTVPTDSVTISGGAVTIGYTPRIKVVYY